MLPVGPVAVAENNRLVHEEMSSEKSRPSRVEGMQEKTHRNLCESTQLLI